jgi:nuclear GTP-binding protein
MRSCSDLSFLVLMMQQARAHLLDVEPFEHAFGPKGKRKRPKLTALDYESLLKKADVSQGIFCMLVMIFSC